MSWLTRALESVRNAFGSRDAGTSTEPCPLKRTALGVIVIGELDEKAVPGVTVEIKGGSPGTKKADQDGTALFKPVRQGRYQVNVKVTGMAEGAFETPPAQSVDVPLGESTPCVVRLRPLSTIQVKVVARRRNKQGAETESPLEGVSITLRGRDKRQGSTPAAPGWFRAAGIRSGDYTIGVSSLGQHAGAYAMPAGATAALKPGETKEVVLTTTETARLRLILIDREDKPIAGKTWEALAPVQAKGKTAANGLIEMADLTVARSVGTLRVTLGTPPAAKAGKPPAAAPAPAAGTPPPYPPPISPAEFKDPSPPTPQSTADAGIVEWALTIDDLAAFDDDPGAKGRLHNLGFACVASSDEKTTHRAVKAYQRHYLKQPAGSGKLADVKADVVKRHDSP